MRGWATLLLFVASGATGCILVMGGIDGYSAVAAGDAGACMDGACSTLSCASALECGDGGSVCCLVANAMTSRASTTCQAGPCPGLIPIQLCVASAECGVAGACTRQTCSVGGSSTVIQACGSVPGCTAAP